VRIAAVVTAACLALGVAACGGAAEETATTAPETTATEATEATETAPLGFTEDIRKSFLDSCSADAPLDKCECALKYLEENSTVEEVAQAGFEAQEGKQPKVLLAAVKACS
jgi:hypothetical protein